MLRDVLQVLDFVHSFGVIHRDIKPDNLIQRDADAKLVLIDFGAVKQIHTQMAVNSQIPATVAIGTPGYMSAEQAQGRPRQNSDIYALGIVAIQAFAGAAGVFLFKDAADTLVILLGVALIGAGVGLFLLRSAYSRLARDYDAVFAVVFCLCGILFVFQDKNTAQEIQTVECLLSGAAIFSASNSILLRQKLK